MPRSVGRRLMLPAALIAGSLTFVPASLGASAEAGPRTRIIVTSTSDASNADTSSLGRVRASPGPDGISLREAIEVTNEAPGRYAIRFAPSLAGQEIRVGSATGLDLPPLVGGGVSIDGDIDDDDRPDVTLRGGFQRPYPAYCRQAEFLCPAFRIVSSGNELRDLNLRTFATGVLFTPATDAIFGSPIETHHTYADNIMAGLAMSDIVWSGITLNWDRCAPPCPSRNTWADTIIRGNTIRTQRYGILFQLSGSIGDRIERFIVERNTIRIVRSAEQERIGIMFEAGAGVRNHIADLTISGNTISGDLYRGIKIGSGVLGGDANTVQRVRITDNIVARSSQVQRRDRADGPWCGGCFGIDLTLGEGSALFDPELRPIQYADRNRIRDVEISRNTLTGPLRRGVTIQPGGNGSSHNRVSGIGINGNTIRIAGLVEGVHIDGGDCYECPRERATAHNRVSSVSIGANEIAIDTRGRYQITTPLYDIRAGGVVLIGGGRGSRDGLIDDVSVSGNRIDTNLIGILVLGGEGRRGMVTGVRIEDNRILRDPTLARDLYLDADEISLIGGWREATGNRVRCQVVRPNGVPGEPASNYVSVLDDAAGRSELPDEFPGGNAVARSCAPEEEVTIRDEERGTRPATRPEGDTGGPTRIWILTLASLVTLVLAIVLLLIRRSRQGLASSGE